jgi:predicted nucleic acid-binding protein
MKPQVYLETTFVSYLTARPSRDVVALGMQQTTVDWWQNQAGAYRLCTSSLVWDEINRGSPDAVERRRAVLADMALLDLNPAVEKLALELIRKKGVPAKAAEDAAHIAVAAVHEVPFILTWNFRHIANANLVEKLRAICDGEGYRLPTICTPEQLKPLKS